MTQPLSPPVMSHQANARSPKAALVISAVWGGVLALWLVLGAAPWIVVVLLATTLPAIWEFATGKASQLTLDQETLCWHSGKAQGCIALDQIDSVRFETRLDLSVRVRVLAQGKRITLPQDVVPPHKGLETALQARGITCSRHHFGIG